MSSQAEIITNEQVSIENLGQLVLISEPIDLTKLDREGEGIIVTDLEFNVNNFGELIENSDAVPIESKSSERKIYFAPGVAREIILGVDPASILNLKLSSKNLEEMRLYLNIWQAALYKYLTERKDDPQVRQLLGENGSPRNVLNSLNEAWNTERQLKTSIDESDFVEKVRRFQSIIAKENKKEQQGQISSIEELFKSLDISSEDLPVSEENLGRYFLEQMNLEEYERKLDSKFYIEMDLLRKNAVFRRNDEGNLTDNIDPNAISTYLALLHVLGEENMGEFLGTFLQEKGFKSIADINQRIFSYVNGLNDNERAVLKNEIKYDVDSIRNETVEAKVDSLLDQWRAESRKRGIKIDPNVALASLDVPAWLKNRIREILDEKGIVVFDRGNVIVEGSFRPAADEGVGTNALPRLAVPKSNQNEEGFADNRKEAERRLYKKIMDRAKKKLRENTYADVRMRADVEEAKRAFEAAKQGGSKKEERRKKYQEWKAKYREWKEWTEKTGKENFIRHLPPEVAHLIQNEEVSFERRRVYQLSEMVQQDFAAIQAYSIFMRGKDGKTVVSRENVIKYLALLHVLDFYYGRTGSNVLTNINVARWYEGLNEAEKAKLLLDVTARVAQYRGTAIPSALSESNFQRSDELKEVVNQTSKNIHYQENMKAYLKAKKELEEKLRKLGKNGRKKLSREMEALKARFKNLQEQRILLKLLTSLQGSLQELA